MGRRRKNLLRDHWDHYIAHARAFNRSFPCMEATPYVKKKRQSKRHKKAPCLAGGFGCLKSQKILTNESALHLLTDCRLSSPAPSCRNTRSTSTPTSYPSWSCWLQTLSSCSGSWWWVVTTLYTKSGSLGYNSKKKRLGGIKSEVIEIKPSLTRLWYPSWGPRSPPWTMTGNTSRRPR